MNPRDMKNKQEKRKNKLSMKKIKTSRMYKTKEEKN
jgi:hypothetical protein